MKNKILVTAFFALLAILVLEFSFLYPKNQNNLQTSAQVPVSVTPPPWYPTRTPTSAYKTPTPPFKSISKYVYITYSCRNDSTNGTYVLTNSNRCRTAAEWLKDANSSCYQKTAGACVTGTGSTTSCVDSTLYSPQCAVKPSYITPTSYKSPTPTPGCNNYMVWFIKFPFDYNNDGVINVIDYQIWMQKNPGVNICPSKTPTPTCIPRPTCLDTPPYFAFPGGDGGFFVDAPTPTRGPCGPLYCPTPPYGCKYYGGDNCTTCGQLICSTITGPQPLNN